MVLFLSVVGAVLSLGGNILIARKKCSGWLWWIGGNVAWIAVNFLDTMNVTMVCMYVIYMVINIIGFVKWRKR